MHRRTNKLNVMILVQSKNGASILNSLCLSNSINIINDVQVIPKFEGVSARSHAGETKVRSHLASVQDIKENPTSEQAGSPSRLH